MTPSLHLLLTIERLIDSWILLGVDELDRVLLPGVAGPKRVGVLPHPGLQVIRASGVVGTIGTLEDVHPASHLVAFLSPAVLEPSLSCAPIQD